MKKIFYLLLFILSATVITGCATGPRYLQIRNSMPPIAQGDGRLYFYRPETGFGAAVQPDVKLNAEDIGEAVPGRFFYVDRPPGNYQVKTTTEVVRTLSLSLETNQVRYVRFDVSMGFFVGHVYPVLVENAEGDSEMGDCHLISSPAK
ncbi:MAG TPA: DUF2846 domain-containing protein [Candidatus Acidoferrum sp.]|jgi:hypothetical protein|nr:DUF2846 domain-containing protein [Candidatus Acidoferrum sp.]